MPDNAVKGSHWMEQDWPWQHDRARRLYPNCSNFCDFMTTRPFSQVIRRFRFIVGKFCTPEGLLERQRAFASIITAKSGPHLLQQASQ